MAKDQRQVDAITARDVDFTQWFTDVCKKAELIDGHRAHDPDLRPGGPAGEAAGGGQEVPIGLHPHFQASASLLHTTHDHA